MADDFLDQEDTSAFLRALAATKSADALAKYCKMNRSNLYKRINGDLKGLSPQLCDALGIEKVTCYILPSNLSEWWARHQATQSKQVE